MLNKQPDYFISELGYPQWQTQQPQDDLGNHKPYRKCRQAVSATPTSHSHSSSHSHCSHIHSSSSSGNRLLPLRETLDDYYKRLLLSEQRARADLDDIVAQQKRQKNQWNVQQQRGEHPNNPTNNSNINHRRNQKCRDKAQASSNTTTTTTSMRKATLMTCDLNSF